MRKSKIQIVRENLNLSSNEIKKELRKEFPDIKNEEVMKLIIEANKKERKTGRKRMQIVAETKRGRKPKVQEDEEIER